MRQCKEISVKIIHVVLKKNQLFELGYLVFHL
jgi:hypothetical protein